MNLPLACPKDGSPLDAELQCPHGHRYPRVEGIPVLLRDDVAQTIGLAAASLAAARARSDPPLYLSTVGVSDEERDLARTLTAGGIDPVVAVLIGATSGYAYRHLIGTLRDYPIPALPLARGHGRTLLDVGCSWGRWSLAAASEGYRVTGIDPSIGALLAARRVARQKGLDVDFVCADARYLPFAPRSFDAVFSYSVLQHFSRADANKAIGEIARVLQPEGEALVQMAHAIGLRSLYHQVRRGLRERSGFDVRYWTVPALRRAFDQAFGEARIRAHCYFGLGLESSDARLMRREMRFAAWLSDVLRSASHRFRPLLFCADSLYVEARRPRAPTPSAGAADRVPAGRPKGRC